MAQQLLINDVVVMNDILSKMDIKDTSTSIEKFHALVKYYNDGHKPDIEEPVYIRDERDMLPVFNKFINRSVSLNINSMFINRIRKNVFRR